MRQLHRLLPVFCLCCITPCASLLLDRTQHRVPHQSACHRSPHVLSSTLSDRQDSTTSSTLPGSTDKEENSFGLSDSEFQSWILNEMMKENRELYDTYSHVFLNASHCITHWRRRYRGNHLLWKRLFKRDRVVKEVIEAVPIIDVVDRWIREQEARQLRSGLPAQNITVIDLCSGKGYLSMMLSEYLPRSGGDVANRVEKFVLVDKAWPMCHAEPEAHHINWDHIYGNNTANPDITYFTTWPIPLHTSKQDIKQPSTVRQLKKRFSASGPVLILGVHLCGTLSIQAIKLYQTIPNAKMIVLKPCCLPPMVYAKRQANFEVGKYQFPTADVCSNGRFYGKTWKGPPRWHMETKFNSWCSHLLGALEQTQDVVEGEDGDDGLSRCRMEQIKVQTKGGYQNTFLFAERPPLSPTLWGDASGNDGRNYNP